MSWRCRCSSVPAPLTPWLPELHLKPVLVELGATVPAPALYLLDSAVQPDPTEQGWLERWAPVVRSAVGVSA